MSLATHQVEAISAGVQPGLTMVVGPPGTGKTDTAVQVMTVLYHNCPGQRTLLITHSNQVRAPRRRGEGTGADGMGWGGAGGRRGRPSVRGKRAGCRSGWTGAR